MIPEGMRLLQVGSNFPLKKERRVATRYKFCIATMYQVT